MQAYPHIHTFKSFFVIGLFFLLLYIWNPEDNVQESFLSFHQLCLRDGTHAVWLRVLMAGNLYPLSHFTSPGFVSKDLPYVTVNESYVHMCGAGACPQRPEQGIESQELAL